MPAQRKKIRIVELDVVITPLVIPVLDVLDRAVGRVVVNERDHSQAIPGGRGELLSRHHEAAVAADDGYRPAASATAAPAQRERPSRA